jgi:DNA-binding winged helix-turn-helix (wHTH) protein
VELYISYLRKKIDAGREPLIHTVRGVGYMIKLQRCRARGASRASVTAGAVLTAAL